MGSSLTGEGRPCQDSDATFGHLIPDKPWNVHAGGTLEVAVRLSQTDLNDADVLGGRETNLTPGINWYLDKSLRLSANLVHAPDLDKATSPYNGRHPSALVERVQYAF